MPILKLNLQFFADENTTENENVETTETTETTNDDNEQENTTFTKSDVDSAVSKAVDKALKNQAKKLEQEKQQAIEDAKKDAAEYAKMTKAQQEEADYSKRIKELEQRERELNLKRLESEVETDLKEKNLPTDFASSLITLEDNEKIKEAISGIKKSFDEAVNNAVKEKLRQDTPPAGNGGTSNNKIPSVAKMAQEHRLIK